MLMFNRYYRSVASLWVRLLTTKSTTVTLSLVLLLPSLAVAQSCQVVISGYVKDVRTKEPMPYANVFLKEAQRGAVSDSTGFFRLGSVCSGGHHLIVSHVGCETRSVYLQVQDDTTVRVQLDHNRRLLNEVAVTGEYGEPTTQAVQSLGPETITERADQNLAKMLDNLSGVSTIGNGSTIAKPVVHGLYGNRLTILNNGIAQSGQQWGVDHAPEIDPLVANHISVIKGVSALQYPGNSLGSVVVVEPPRIEEELHLHGKGSYLFASNGRGHGLNLQLQRYRPSVAWRVNGTLRKQGDQRTPDYWLRNTGSEEAHVALQLEKKLTSRWTSDLYFSSFNTALGVLRGSHVGNLTDLDEALARDVPFFTEDTFSYRIRAPYQRVNHHLLKLRTQYVIDDQQRVEVTYAGQLNNRKEFDVRRSGRSEKPALSLRQLSHFLEGKYVGYLSPRWNLNAGLQFNRTNNTNIPETGILPLIPNYLSHESGAFALISGDLSNHWAVELGGRYDYENRRVAAISTTGPRRVVDYQNQYHNLGAAGGVSYTYRSLRFAYNLGYARRNPEVNELYSNGLHQGVSSIEEGTPTLKAEKSLKTTFAVEGKVRHRLSFESLFYFQRIADYIFLNPQDELRLTIRGAFPVFEYQQTNARIYGLDLASTYAILTRLNATLKYSYIRGVNSGDDLPLINMPANNLFTALNYQIERWRKLENIDLEINSKYVFEQRQLLLSQDFVAPPEGYYLVGLRLSAERQLKKVRLHLHATARNLLNVAYRDYLNRQRYFADDLGTNVTVGISISF